MRWSKFLTLAATTLVLSVAPFEMVLAKRIRIAGSGGDASENLGPNAVDPDVVAGAGAAFHTFYAVLAAMAVLAIAFTVIRKVRGSGEAQRQLERSEIQDAAWIDKAMQRMSAMEVAAAAAAQKAATPAPRVLPPRQVRAAALPAGGAQSAFGRRG